MSTETAPRPTGRRADRQRQRFIESCVRWFSATTDNRRLSAEAAVKRNSIGLDPAEIRSLTLAGQRQAEADRR